MLNFQQRPHRVNLGGAQVSEQQEQKLGVLDKIDRVITGIVYGLMSIPIILLTLVWFAISGLIFYWVWF